MLTGGRGIDDLTAGADFDNGNGGAGVDTTCDVEAPVNWP
jgi:hypothetical protein